jgi:glycine/D-amino acid oxidase-like deaminating enzyme
VGVDTQRWKAVKTVAVGGARLVGEGRDVLRSNGRLAVRSALGRVRANLAGRPASGSSWRRQPLAHSYDVVVVGDRLGAFVAAEVLTRRSPGRRVAVLVPGFAGQELPCRPRAVLRTVRERAAEAPIVERSAALYQRFVGDQGMGARLRAQPCLLLARDLEDLGRLEVLATGAARRAELVPPADAAQLVAHLDASGIAGALVERDVLSADIDELLWELGGRASAAGAEIVEHCRLEGLEAGPAGWTVITSRGRAQAEVVIDATADGRALATVGEPAAESWRRWEGVVTQHVQPFLRAHLVVGGAEVSQTARGEVLVSGHATPYPARQAGGSVEAAAWLAAQATAVVPRLGALRVVAQTWRADLVAHDGLPSVGATGHDGLLRLGGTGSDPFALEPALGEAVAHLALGEPPPVVLADLAPGRPAGEPVARPQPAVDTEPGGPVLSPLAR